MQNPLQSFNVSHKNIDINVFDRSMGKHYSPLGKRLLKSFLLLILPTQKWLVLNLLSTFITQC